jgi:hypothetical protein
MNTLAVLNEHFDLNHYNRKQRRELIAQFRGLSLRKKAEMVKWIEDKNFHIKAKSLPVKKV